MKTPHARVLVVDDDLAMLRAVERILAPRYEVRVFASGREAVDAFAKDPAEVAIVDVRMPGMDGFEVTRALRAIRPGTEVILVTGSITDLDEKMVRAIEERAFYFITKPFSKAVLTSLVAWCLEMQRLHAERDDLIRRLTEDLERARRFQRALLPQGLPREFGPVRAAAAWVSSEQVGGDLFDILPLAEDRVLLMVADVAGHGVGAALLTGMVKTAVGRSLQERVDLGEAARSIVHLLVPLRQSRVVTAFLGIVDARAGTLDYLNAGHPPAAILKEGRDPRLLPATTAILSYGLEMAPQPSVRIPFASGDRLAIYSDGVYEVRDPAGGEFGRDRLLKVLSSARGPLERIVESVMEETRRHAAGRPPDDDLTLLLAERIR
ncbi:MAG: PP2C family protein-serine/threonine phosphatase [Candidatus Polarisedimenticolia bacterium]